MFVFNEGGSGSSVLIPQVSHAWMAWQVADHWGNRRFPRPAPRAEVLTAVLLHDSGWPEYDAAPGLGGSGRVRTFDSMPPDAHLGIWRTSVARAAMHARYSGLLVAAHFTHFAGVKGEDLLARGDTANARRSHSLKAELERQQSGWREELAGDARYEPHLRGPRWQTNLQVLSACDTISVFLCADHRRQFTFNAIDATGDTVTCTADPIDDRIWRVHPWPLEGPQLRLQCEGRRLPRATFESAEELHEMLRTAPVERIGFTLLRPSARA